MDIRAENVPGYINMHIYQMIHDYKLFIDSFLYSASHSIVRWSAQSCSVFFWMMSTPLEAGVTWWCRDKTPNNGQSLMKSKLKKSVTKINDRNHRNKWKYTNKIFQVFKKVNICILKKIRMKEEYGSFRNLLLTVTT